MLDPFVIGGITLSSRLFIGTGKYSRNTLIPEVVASSGSQVITVALRRVDPESRDNIVSHIPPHMTLLPNTSGARTAGEAVRIARLARAAGLGNWVKIEVINDQKYLLPDNLETIRATEILAAEGFVVLPYMSPDLSAAIRMKEAGAAAIMPLGSPIGSNRGLRTKELLRILISEVDLPVIVDAGIGRPSEAAEAMELGASAVLLNTAIATARDPLLMAEAFREAVSSGRKAYLAGLGPVEETAVASSPLTGFLK
ncbi:thiazole synthase [Paenibacillus sonchi]|uniref:Thiazole synthase n=2 Tax=Paenibacillus sonchi group TaxID=2044880 RepID=A0A974P874_9BACL|nr:MULTISPECIES: thiazole synthase [Paenibacillus sonchi group]KWX78142.1 thiazole synthase [Paenibacillus riograndensis]MCE3200087.1 thiazole synthase [Paenibacillus sonchi]QQZ59090.1 thiazole synthase [Paenibacillus sonchi]